MYSECLNDSHPAKVLRHLSRWYRKNEDPEVESKHHKADLTIRGMYGELEKKLRGTGWRREAWLPCEEVAEFATETLRVDDAALKTTVVNAVSMASHHRRHKSKIIPTDALTSKGMRMGFFIDAKCEECIGATKELWHLTSEDVGDRDELLVDRCVIPHITSCNHRNRVGFPKNGDCYVCGRGTHLSTTCHWKGSPLNLQRENRCHCDRHAEGSAVVRWVRGSGTATKSD